ASGTRGAALSDMLIYNESFNEYFQDAPLDQLVANSEASWKQFADNSGHIESLLTHANSTLSQLDEALHGQPANIATIIHQLGFDINHKPVYPAPAGDTGHCSVSPDGRQHYLDTDQYHFPPGIGPYYNNCTFAFPCSTRPYSSDLVGDRFSDFASLFAS